MVGKPKIMVFIDWYIPAYKAGGPIKSVKNIVSRFSSEADFYIVTSDRDFGDEQPFSDVITNQWQKVGNAEVIYLSSDHQNKNKFLEILKEVNPEVVYFNSLFSKNFTLTPIKALRKLKTSAKVILAPRGMLGKGALSIKPLKKHLFLRVTKMTGFFRGIVWHASTIQEKKEIQLYFGSGEKVVIAENIAMMPDEEAKQKKQNKEKLKVLFVSRISSKKNLEFLIRSLAKTNNKERFSLTVVGPVEEEEYFQRCMLIAEQNNLAINYTGALHPNELSEQYCSHDLFALPTLHENYGHVIIEAMSFGVPLLISKNTPWLGLENKGVGFDLELKENLFTDKLNEFLMMEDDEFSIMSEATIKWAEEIICNKKVLEDNRQLFGLN